MKPNLCPNSVSMKGERGMVELENALSMRMKTQDVSHRKSIKLVDINGNRKKTSMPDDAMAAVDDELWLRYGMELLRVDLRKHQKQQAITQDNSLPDERRFWTSTQSRRMFKRLMCLAAGDNQPRTIADIASELYITHKAASQLVKDGMSFSVLKKELLSSPTGSGRQTKGRYAYCATDKWFETFLQNGLRFSFEWAEELMRKRELFNEWHRYRLGRQS